MKKTITLGLVLLCLYSNAKAYDFSSVAPSGQTLYYKIVVGGATVVPRNASYPYYYSYPSGDLIVPDSVTYNGITYAVTSLGDAAFHWCSGLTSITLPETITHIYGGAFSGCSGLTFIRIPSKVRIIYDGIFSFCSNLRTIYFDADSCLNMGTSESTALDYCDSLSKVVVGGNVKYIPDRAFKDCHSLDSVVLLPLTPPVLGNNAFAGNAPTRKFYIPCGLFDIYSDYYPRTEPDGPDFLLTVQTNNSNLGTASVVTDGENDILCDSTAVIQANVIEPNHFLRWNNGSVVQTDNIVVSCDTTITALFVKLTVGSDNNAYGTATHEKQSNLVEKIQATPNNGYRFDHWSNGSMQNPSIINLTSDSLITAFFIADGGFESVADVSVERFKIYQRDGNIVVVGADGDMVTLFDNVGRLLETKKSKAEELFFDVPGRGVYHIKVDNHPARKIVVL